MSLGCTWISEMMDRDECSNIIFTGNIVGAYPNVLNLKTYIVSGINQDNISLLH